PARRPAAPAASVAQPLPPLPLGYPGTLARAGRGPPGGDPPPQFRGAARGPAAAAGGPVTAPGGRPTASLAAVAGAPGQLEGGPAPWPTPPPEWSRLTVPTPAHHVLQRPCHQDDAVPLPLVLA